MKKLLLILLLFPLIPHAQSKYYFSASGSDAGTGAIGSPWQTLTKFASVANAGTFAAGDSIFFNRNNQFAGHVQIGTTGGRNAKSGTAGAHIVVSAYGTGALPTFLYSGPGSTPEGRTLFQFWGIRYWDFYNMNFTDLNTTNDHTTMSNTTNGFPLYLGDPNNTKCWRITVKNCTWSLTGMGIVIYGDSCNFQYNNMSNFKVLKNNGNTSDYGSNPFTILDGTYNDISYNTVSGGWSASDEFGYSGGMCEMFGVCSFNRIHHNTIDDTNGISEFGSNGATSTATDNYFYFNKLTNIGADLYCNIGGIFATQVANCYYYQNVKIEQDGVSRFSGSNLAAGLTGVARTASLGSPDGRNFGYNTNPSATNLYILKNNVFQCNTPMDICQSGTTKTVHTYNYYKLSGGSVPNVTLSTGEVAGSATLFENTASGNANGWSFIPSVGSPLIAAGQTIVGYGIDFVGRPIVDNMGLYGPIPPAGAITFPVTIGPTTYTGWKVGP